MTFDHRSDPSNKPSLLPIGSAMRRAERDEFRGRFAGIALAMVLCFLCLIGRLFELQVLDADQYQAVARDNIVRNIRLASTRGIIRDRNGKVLAANRPSYNVYVVPERLDMQSVWPKFVDYIGVAIDERERLEALIETIRKSDGPRKHQQILLKEDISRDAVANLVTHAAELPGIDVVPVPVRYYPFEELGAHLLGYMSEVDAEKLSRLRHAGYIEGDRIGAMGIERSWESYLRGTRGREEVIVDAKGRRRPEGKQFVGALQRVEPIPGRNIRLTIDIDLQKAADIAFRGKLAGGAVLIDVRTGHILAMYSKPSFNPNALSGGSGKQVIREAFRALYQNALRPVLDKTTTGSFPPGSTFKPFTALAALERGLIDPRTVTSCRGALDFGRRTFRCSHVHGVVDMHKALAESCNVYFYRLAAEHGVSMDVVAELGLRFGLGTKTGLGVNGEVSGRMPTKAWMTLRNKGQYRLGYGLNAAIGQGATTVTVLQLALAYAALANGGTLYQPQIVRAVENADGGVIQEFHPQVRRLIGIDPKNLKLVQDALEAGVNEEGGTAHGIGEVARHAGIVMAGKTGTAQVSRTLLRGVDAERASYFHRDHAWFAGYAPVQSPDVAVVAFVEHGGFGGKHAAPIAFELVRAYQSIARKANAPGGRTAPPSGRANGAVRRP